MLNSGELLVNDMLIGILASYVFRICFSKELKENGNEPKSGDIVFFDWNKQNVGRDGSSDHVGIVEKVENGKVYTIEGNSGDECFRREYDLNSLDILGYGTPMYN